MGVSLMEIQGSFKERGRKIRVASMRCNNGCKKVE